MATRPSVHLPFDRLDRVLIALATLGLLLNFIWVWTHLAGIPDRVPTKFSFSGEPVAWAGRGMLWLMPGMSAFIYPLLILVARYPQAHNFPWEITEQNAEGLYRLSRRLCYWILNLLVYDFLFSNYFIIEVARGNYSGLPIWFVPVSFFAIVTPVIIFFRRGKRLAAVRAESRS